MVGLFIFFRFQIELSHPSFLNHLTDLSVLQQFQLGLFSALFVSLLLATLFSLFDVFVLNQILFKRSLRFVLSVGLLGHAIFIALVMFIMLDVFRFMVDHLSLNRVLAFELEQILPITIILIILSFGSRLFIEIDRKLGPGNLGRLITARFYTPREVQRIFMFVDLRDSTGIAERLGHLRYSSFLQDCFQDFAIVDEYCAEIYQYVGDEAVISWSLEKGTKSHNFLAAFFAYKRLLKSRSEYYLKKYGIVPYFKAGLNSGPVVVTEVGAIKRELSFHGDTLNTASRIQGKCNELGAQVLIPENLYIHVKDNPAYVLKEKIRKFDYIK